MTAPLVIAHRGASGYLPEHTLPAKSLAYAMGADYLEQDVVASADDQLVVLHDIYLDRVTNVAAVFPLRVRTDGRYYVRDFNMAELRILKSWERMDHSGAVVYPQRYPARSGEFRIHTLREELDLICGLNSATGGNTGVYVEIKRPAWHRKEGIDIAPLLLQILAEFNYRSHSDDVYVQCFDSTELHRIRHELKCPLKLVQLIGENSWDEADSDFDKMRLKSGLRALAGTVDAIGPWLHHFYNTDEIDGSPVSTNLADNAHAAGLDIHPYTFRADEVPRGFASFDQLICYFLDVQAVDGLFTDFPDRVRKIVDRQTK
jgi:glycerophosphoryl diester phosphodiesterase